MKAWTLCLVLSLTTTLAANAETQKPRIDFNELIVQAENQQVQAHRKVTPKEGTIAFYNNDWLRLRQRKKTALAQAEIKLRRNVASAGSLKRTAGSLDTVK